MGKQEIQSTKLETKTENSNNQTQNGEKIFAYNL
jgi:hypothetical protein